MIYLDSAATSMLKPDKVKYAVLYGMNTMASPGRGAHEAAMRAAELCYDCRENLGKLLGAAKTENIVFTFNATHALNIAIRSLAKKGMRVLISGYEHNSVVRPLRAIGAELMIVDTPLFDTDAFLAGFRKKLPSADAVVFTHVSNAFGYILPVERLATLCRQSGKPFIIDASQSAGVLKLNFDLLGADFVAMPGHKGLLGPQGTGVLLCKNEARPLLYGGSGSDSRAALMPDYLPDRLEAGTHNVPGIAGLNEGVKYLISHGCAADRERTLLETFRASLAGVNDTDVYYSPDAGRQCGVISVRPRRISCERVGELLSEQGVAVRTGLHCAPLAHETVGTLESGTVRFSFSPFNSTDEVEKAAEITKKIINSV